MYEPAIPPGTIAQRRGADGAALRFEATFHHAPVGIAHVSPRGRFLEVNEQFAAITGHSRAALIEHGFQHITHPDDLSEDLQCVGEMLAGRRSRYRTEKRYLRPDRTIVWVELTVALIRDANGAPDFFISIIEDRSEVMKARREATRDSLTGALNRRGLDERLAHERARCAEADTPLTLVYLDLDRFKPINDALGHAAGDACLRAVVAALREAAPPEGRVARMGGDEFLIMLPRVPATAGNAVLARMHAALESVEYAPGQPLSGSFGAITVAPGDGRSNDALIALADQAMYEAKRRRRELR